MNFGQAIEALKKCGSVTSLMMIKQKYGLEI